VKKIDHVERVAEHQRRRLRRTRMNLRLREGSSNGESFFTCGEKDQQMNATNVSALARHLFETEGAKAIAQAAHKAASFEQAGDKEQANMWQRVEAVLREMRGPRQS
jgi:hypothetical protein